jgi:MFS family permease
MRRPRIPGVLRDGNFARFLAATTVSTLGGGMANIALAFAVLGQGGVTELGIVLLAREIPLIVFVLLGGVFADRLRRKTILISTDLIKAAAQGMTAFLFFTGTADVVTVSVLQIIFGVANAFSRPAFTGLVREILRDDQLQEANALLGLSNSILHIAGPALGALIVAAGSPAIALGIDALTFLISAALMLSMHIARVVRIASTSVLADLRSGWRELISRPWLVAMILSFGMFQLTFFPALAVLGPAVAQSSLGGPTAWGLILSLESVGAVVGGLVALRLRVTRPLVAGQLFCIPCGLLLIGLGVPLHVALLAFLSAGVGFGFAAGNTFWMTALQQNVPEHAMSRISSFDWLGSVAFNPLGYLLIGPLASTIGTAETLILSGLINLATAIGVLLVPSVRAIRMVGTPAATDPDDEPPGPLTELA